MINYSILHRLNCFCSKPDKTYAPGVIFDTTCQILLPGRYSVRDRVRMPPRDVRGHDHDIFRRKLRRSSGGLVRVGLGEPNRYRQVSEGKQRNPDTHDIENTARKSSAYFTAVTHDQNVRWHNYGTTSSPESKRNQTKHAFAPTCRQCGTPVRHTKGTTSAFRAFLSTSTAFL